MPEAIKGTVITDVGSTTTKAILLDLSSTPARLVGQYSYPTTVESPSNDVRLGVKQAVLGLEKLSGSDLIADKSNSPDLIFREGISYLSTSSAGGGLQILVIGLTLFDSASSAKRAAYGAGGIILDTFAIDDKRQASQQMLSMRRLHPDMILLCGGTDGGAISGVLRMAEIMRVARPQPKFETNTRIPTLYAGNQEAIPMIKQMISKDFDLYILPNLRPTMSSENLQPTQARIQELFMENVMERAPGYSKLKSKVSSAILPTPVGVMRSLSILAEKDRRNVFAFDIGGATTDVFSQINGHFQRTVSANLGMSYSALNVMKESGIDKLLRWLPDGIGEDTLRNYIANKCLLPTSLPISEAELKIEQALAREALRIALDQHREMHYNSQKIGFLDKIVDNETDGFDRKFNYQHYEDQYQFHESEIDLIIAAGGIFAHTDDPLVSAMIVVDAIRPKGITEIKVDKNFTSPHLGVLSDTDPRMAQTLLDECLQGLAWHVAPIFPKGTRKGGLELSMERDGRKERIIIEPGKLQIIPAGQKALSFTTTGKAYLSLKHKDQQFSTELPVIIDTRENEIKAGTVLTAAPPTPVKDALPARQMELPTVSAKQEWTREILLPYKGEIRYNPGATVNPTDVVAVNRFNPPRLFIVDGLSKFTGLSGDQIRGCFIVKPGDELDFDQLVAEVPDNPEWPHYLRKARKVVTPVRGKVEFIDPATGLMVLSEVQDYSMKPVSVNLAEALGVQPKRVGRYLSKAVGDFVYRGDPLASRKDQTPDGPVFRFVKSPSTGSILSVDPLTGILTLKYLSKPIEFQAHVQGTVSDTTLGQGISIAYQASRLDGILGLGKDCSGRLRSIHKSTEIYGDDLKGTILICAEPPSPQDLKTFAAAGVAGLICYSISEKVLSAFLGSELGVINTGNEALPFSVLLLDGFATDPMPGGLWNSLKSLEGRHCYLAPHTRIRAGVVRPFADFQ